MSSYYYCPTAAELKGSAGPRRQRAGDGLRKAKRPPDPPPSSLRADPRPAPHLAPQLLLQLPVVVVPDQEVQGEVATALAGRGHGEKAAAGPSPPACQASAPGGVSCARPPGRRPARERENEASERRARYAERWATAGCGRRGRSGVAGWVGDGVGRAHPAPRRAPARADSSRTDFCGPNCPKQGSARGEPPRAAAGRDAVSHAARSRPDCTHPQLHTGKQSAIPKQR